MVERFVISDTHFHHSNILTFTNWDESPVRTFASVEEMDQTMIDNWNKIVGPNDIVCHLGDLTMSERYISIVAQCNGSKRLILGNHDIFPIKKYEPYFKRIYAMRIFPDKCIMTHIPIHWENIGRFKKCIHGHIHCETIKDHGELYYNACVEKNNYTPVPLDLIC